MRPEAGGATATRSGRSTGRFADQLLICRYFASSPLHLHLPFTLRTLFFALFAPCASDPFFARHERGFVPLQIGLGSFDLATNGVQVTFDDTASCAACAGTPGACAAAAVGRSAKSHTFTLTCARQAEALTQSSPPEIT
jgi:hypothetical protein